MTISGAIARLQALTQAAALSANFKIREAPDTPIQSAAQLPLSIAYISGANGGAEDATWNLVRYTLTVEIHFNAASLRNVYTQLNAIIPALMRYLSGDPTLSGEVESIIYPVNVTVAPSNFDGVPTIGAVVEMQVKVLAGHLPEA